MRWRLSSGVRRLLGAAAVLLVGLTIGGIIMFLVATAEEVAAEGEAGEAASVLADTLAVSLEAITAPADAMRAQIVAKHGRPDLGDLRTFALEMRSESIDEGYPLKSLSIAPGNVVEAVWPLKGNETAIGLNLAATPAQWDPIKDRIAAGKPVLTGPIDLVQGGRAFVYRTPVVLDDGTYWGLSSAVIDYSTVADLARAAALKNGVYISSRSPSGDVVDVFGSPAAPGRHVEVKAFPLPGSTWQVEVTAARDSTRALGTVGAVAVALSCAFAALTYWAIGLRQRVNGSRELVEVLAREAPVMLFQYRTAPDGRMSFDYVSPRLVELMGWDASRLAVDASEVWNSVAAEDLSKTRAAVGESLQELTPLATRMRMRTRDDQLRWFQLRARPEAQSGGDVVLHGYLADVTEEAVLEDRLAVHASMYRVVPSGVLILSSGGLVADVNPAFTALTGYQPGDVVGRPLDFLAADVGHDETHEALWRDADDPGVGVWRGPFAMRDADGRVVEFAATALFVRDEDGALSHLVLLFSPLSDLRDDIVTGLPGRPFFLAQGDIEIGRRADSHSEMVLAVVDLDRFADLNDSFGHPGGDQVLRTLAARLQAGMPDQLALARVGGDQFAVLLPTTADIYGPTSRLGAIVAEPFTVNGMTVRVGASIGVAAWPQDARDAAGLLDAAWQALGAAKMSGRGQVRHFTEQMRQAATLRARVLESLDHINDSDDFSVVFQPIVDLASRRVVKAEALARMSHPLLGQISPEVFIPIAEDGGQVGAIGDFVFGHAARLVARARVDDPAFTVAVNISPVELSGPAAVHRQRLALLQTLGLPGSAITLEITEQSLLEDNAATQGALKLYREQGVQIAIDDFGTGYSSLSYLNKTRTDYLKIDRSFVAQLASGTEIFTLVSVIIEMARSLSAKTVAEGIETKDQLHLLREAGCDFGQGYLFAAPLSGEKLLEIINQQYGALRSLGVWTGPHN